MDLERSCQSPVKGGLRPAHGRTRTLIVGCAIAVLIAACGAAPSNGMLHIVNMSSTDASVHWQSPGFFGTPLFGGSGTEPVGACADYARGFASGTQELTVTTGAAAASFELVAPSTGQETLWVEVSRDGSIAKIDAAAAPASPFCGG